MNLMRRKKRYILYGLVAIVFFCLIAYYHIGLVLSESLYVVKGSYPYYILIPKDIRHIPLLKPLASGIYFYSSGDGNKPALAEVSYDTLQNENNSLEFYNDLFTSLGYENLEVSDFWGKLAFRSSLGIFIVNIENLNTDIKNISVELVM